MYLESIILNKDEERYWMTGGNTGMLPIRIILEIYPICHGASGTEVLVTPVGCGTVGYTPEEMAPMLKDAAFLENLYLLISFRYVLMWE